MAKTPIKPATETYLAPPQELHAVEPYTRFSDFDIGLFSSGKHYNLYEKFGSHVIEHLGVRGTYFAVWAPNAKYVAVIGNFNGWNKGSHPLFCRWDSSGIWEGFIPHVGNGEVYKYYIHSTIGSEHEKGDPFALAWEHPPLTASIVWDTWYEWQDADWLKNRHAKNALNAPFSVYEVHLGSWQRHPDDENRKLGYREIADVMVPYLQKMNFTHVEFMPVMEHPYEPSWGYQITGYFAVSSRFGKPQDFMYLIEQLHRAGIGVILDWVPSHFPNDAHGLYQFDGTALYEHEDPRLGYHPDWKSYIFNYGRSEVRSFLISNALFWLDRYHVDGLRVDAVASMLYLDYSRNAGEWIPNVYGGRENLEAISLFKELNEQVYARFPDVQTIAEESTAFSGVSRPLYTGGLGFGMKWMMGWMNDTLKYFEKDPSYRKWHQNQLTFSMVYAFTENFMLPLSHDEVVYGKQALVSKMPGDEWQRFANLRLLYAYMYSHPGTKLLFMGAEFGQTSEWNFQKSLDWYLTEFAPHQGMQAFMSDLNLLYRSEGALFDKQFSPDGFEWIDASDSENSIVSYCRKGYSENESLLIVLNLTPMPRHDYYIGVPFAGNWQEVLNSDKTKYWGSGIKNNPSGIASFAHQIHGREHAISLSIPPLAALFLKCK